MSINLKIQIKLIDEYDIHYPMINFDKYISN